MDISDDESADGLLQALLTMEFPSWLGYLVQFVAVSAMIFGGVVPYIPQYLEIRKSQNSEGFSTFVCLTLLIANILRILFWFGHPFELPLLAQSVMMNITMLLMVHVCTQVKTKTEIIASKSRTFTDPSQKSEESNPSYKFLKDAKSKCEVRLRSRFRDLDHRYFWQWTDFGSYLQFLTLFTMVVGFTTSFLINIAWYVEFIGFLAVFFEAMLGAPQFYRNYQNKSTKGMSVKMVLMWLSGDVFKTVYFLVREAPVQFWMCGFLQISLDISILCQVYAYHGGVIHIKPLVKEAVQ